MRIKKFVQKGMITRKSSVFLKELRAMKYAVGRAMRSVMIVAETDRIIVVRATVKNVGFDRAR